jgi:hypothetical protein
MHSEEYDVKPANNMCSKTINNTVIIPQPGSQTEQNLNNTNSINDQHLENSKYDNVDSINVKPLYGGVLNKNTNFKIFFKKNIININATNELEAINIFLKNKYFNKDYLLEIQKYNNNKSLYLIRCNKKNKKHIVRKLYS